jgi:hypothetical protein
MLRFVVVVMPLLCGRADAKSSTKMLAFVVFLVSRLTRRAPF